MFALLQKSKQPVFVVGRGLINEDVTAAMAALAEQTGIPVGALQYTPDAFPTSHALALGPLGLHAQLVDAARRVLDAVESLLLLGPASGETIALLLRGALEAGSKVGLKMNLPKSALDAVVKSLPALRNPTISQLSSPDWIALETIIDESVVREIIPQLKALGAEGIVEYPLNKVVY